MPSNTGVRGIYRMSSVQKLRKTPINEIVQALSAHSGLVIQTAARILGDASEAQDVAQDIAEKLLRTPPRNVRSWPALLKTMATNAAIDRRRRRREVDPDAEPLTHQGPEQALRRQQQARVLRLALDQLSKRDARLFSLAFLAELSHREIGEQLNMNANAVGVALHRLRQRLGERLQSMMDETLKGGA